MKMPTAKMTRLGQRIETACWIDPQGRFWWIVVPPGLTRELAKLTQQHHGPFASEAEVDEDQRVTLLGPQCRVIDKEGWPPADERGE